MPIMILAAILFLTACAPVGWHKYMAPDGTDTGPYANTIRLAYAFEYDTSQYDCMCEKGFKLRR